jgi:predicted membrane channel-forming protein YqfA (hemolysin III family)
VVHSSYSDLFVVIATAAATLIGLLFVAMSVAKGRSQQHSPVIREFRAAASLLAFSNSFAVSLFGLVPGNNIGYPALIIGLIGVFFTAAGVRTTLSLPAAEQRRRAQFFLIMGLLGVFVFQCIFGFRLISNPDRHGALATLGDVLIASLLLGIGRAWELVGDWDTGIVASIGLLLGTRDAPRDGHAAPTPDEDGRA